MALAVRLAGCDDATDLPSAFCRSRCLPRFATMIACQWPGSAIDAAQHSYSLLSWELKLAAMWGGHEGSLLLWVLLLSAWSALFAWQYRQQTDPLFPLTLAVLSLSHARRTATVCSAVVRSLRADISTSNRRPRSQSDAATSRSYLSSTAALPWLWRFDGSGERGAGEFTARRVDAACARICWRWALPGGWSALTAGIILGSWWAYCELGWGGWWFWDPVENASLLPWLSATALLHSLSLTRQRGIFRHWSLLLAIVTLMLSLLVPQLSVLAFWFRFYAFALDNVRAVPLFSLFALISLASLALYGWRARDGGPAVRFSGLSRKC